MKTCIRKIFQLIYLLALLISNLNSQWQIIQTPVSLTIRDICVVSSSVIWASCDSSIVLRTVDGGINWQIISVTKNNTIIQHITATDSAYAWVSCMGNTKIFFTSNGGQNWKEQIYSPANWVNKIHFFNHNTGIMLTGPTNGTIGYFVSRNSGESWVLSPNSPKATIFGDNRVSITDTNLICFVADVQNQRKIFKLTGGLDNAWQSFNVTSFGTITHASFKNAKEGIATDGLKIIKSLDGGMSWVIHNTEALNGYIVNSMLSVRNSNWIIVNNSNSIRISYDYCNSWNPIHNMGTGSYFNYASSYDTSSIYLSGFSGKIYKYNSDYIGIYTHNNKQNMNFKLYQNYPNPFNPFTKIKFYIPANGLGQATNVKLLIYNIVGREVTILVNNILKPGTYEVEWDGTNYPTGIYYYCLKINNHTFTRKMVLSK